jgi:histidinol-phosphatase (PHP family)
MIISDSHVHSVFSCDGKSAIEDVVASAIAKGLKYICFTEHLDYNLNNQGFEYFDFKGYTREIERIRDIYASSIMVLKGIEFSEPHIYREEFEKEQSRDYDMIIGSLHFMENQLYGSQSLLDQYGLEKVMEKYFANLCKMIGYGGFDVLGHPDFPRRYYGKEQSESGYISEAMKKLADSGISLEINTSGFRKGYDSTLPDTGMIVRYAGFGGRNVTTGSDSHRAEETGADLEKASDIIGRLNLVQGVYISRKFVPV